MSKFVCLTPVKNEAWILNAFLKATSLWADHIIIADQQSTDGSKEIAQSFEKVTLVENNRAEMHQAATRRLLLSEAAKIEGDKIVFCLDADEFFSGDFLQSNGWEKICQSKPGDVFWFKWMNILPSKTEYLSSTWLYFAAHFNDEILNGQFPDNYIHEWRLPYPKKEEGVHYIEDISFLHFARVNEKRQKNKERYYQVVTKSKEPSMSAVSLYRMYNENFTDIRVLEPSAFYFYEENGLDLYSEIDLQDEGEFYSTQIKAILNRGNISDYKYLSVWTNEFLIKNNLEVHSTILSASLIYYLQLTNKNKNSYVVRFIDKLLKLLNF